MKRNSTTGKGTLVNDRYLDFLKFALHHILEVALLFENEAKLCKNPVNKTFLYFLAGKKRVQHIVLEIIAVRNQGEYLRFSNYTKIKGKSDKIIKLSEATSDEIFKYASEKAERDLNLFASLASLEEDSITKKLLVTLTKLAKDYIKDISTGFSKFTMKDTFSTAFIAGLEGAKEKQTVTVAN